MVGQIFEARRVGRVVIEQGTEGGGIRPLGIGLQKGQHVVTLDHLLHLHHFAQYGHGIFRVVTGTVDRAGGLLPYEAVGFGDDLGQFIRLRAVERGNTQSSRRALQNLGDVVVIGQQCRHAGAWGGRNGLGHRTHDGHTGHSGGFAAIDGVKDFTANIGQGGQHGRVLLVFNSRQFGRLCFTDSAVAGHTD